MHGVNERDDRISFEEFLNTLVPEKRLCNRSGGSARKKQARTGNFTVCILTLDTLSLCAQQLVNTCQPVTHASACGGFFSTNLLHVTEYIFQTLQLDSKIAVNAAIKSMNTFETNLSPMSGIRCGECV
jgi:hypothetical protein